MNPALAAGCAAAVIGGALLVAAGLRKTPAPPPRPPVSLWQRVRGSRRDTRTHLYIGAVAGVVVFAATGWLVAVAVCPAFALLLPSLLAPKGGADVARLDAMAEWTRSLGGTLSVGAGLEQAIFATQRSAPAALSSEVDNLIARLRARWSTEDALRAFADDLDDATGDLIAAALILAARRRGGGGLVAVLDGLAASVAAEVKARRQIEADRAKPRATARWVTIITLLVLGGLMLNGTYLAPYGTPVGQVILAVLLTCYGGALLWLRQAAVGKPHPRFLGAAAAEQAAR